MTDAKITEAMAGCWLDGNQGWHNHHRVVEIAQHWGWKGLDEWADGEAIVTRYTADEAGDDDHEAMVGQGGIVDQATEYLEGLTVGCHFVWDMGELALIPCEDMEGFGTNDGCGCEVAA